MAEPIKTAQRDTPAATIGALEEPGRPQDFYEGIKQRFAGERDLRLRYRPEGTGQFISDLTGALAAYEVDPHLAAPPDRAPIEDTVEVLFIGGGFSALLTAARLRERGVQSIRPIGGPQHRHMALCGRS